MRDAPRIALLCPYWNFFEPNAPFDLRAERRRIAQEVKQLLTGLTVVADEVVDSREQGEQASDKIRAARPDALLVLQTMAVPPAFTLAALDRLEKVPLVVFAAHVHTALADDFDDADITAGGATVGVPQLTNMLHRRGRRHALVVGSLQDDVCRQDLRSALQAAAAAGRFRGARVIRVGEPIDGYDCVDCDDDALTAAAGIEVVRIPPGQVRDAYLEVDADRVGAIARETRRAWRLGPRVEEDESLERSVAFAAALEALDRDLGAAAGAMNCHVPEIRFGDQPGIAPCFALGRETSNGIPWSCSGDVLTAIAMLTLKLLGAPTLYHEIESLDYARDEAVLANTGEHDLGFSDPEIVPELRRNKWFDRPDRPCGVCACFSPPAGPGTLVAFTPHPSEPSGFRFIVAEGAFASRSFPQTGTPNAAFRFTGDEAVARPWARWVGAGANHHSAATLGHCAPLVEGVARHLGIGARRIA